MSKQECTPVNLAGMIEPSKEMYKNHHWTIDEAEGKGFVDGKCKKCGKKRSDFRGISSLDMGDQNLWGNPINPKKKRRKKGQEIDLDELMEFEDVMLDDEFSYLQ